MMKTDDLIAMLATGAGALIGDRLLRW